MRKMILLLIPFLLFGCSKNLNIDGDITEIKYNDILLNKEDFEGVEKLINTTYDKNLDEDLPNKLTVKTSKDIYYFSLSNEELEYGGKVSFNDKLGKYLQNLSKKYTDKNFYTIDYMKNYEANNNDKTILLDKTSNYIVINFGKKVSNLKINEIEMENDTFKDVDLLYSQDDVKESKLVIRKSVSYDVPDIRISFENEYHYVVSIIPTYDVSKDGVEFITSFKAK